MTQPSTNLLTVVITMCYWRRSLMPIVPNTNENVGMIGLDWFDVPNRYTIRPKPYNYTPFDPKPQVLLLDTIRLTTTKRKLVYTSSSHKSEIQTNKRIKNPNKQQKHHTIQIYYKSSLIFSQHSIRYEVIYYYV
jgi:hypothetical protein